MGLPRLSIKHPVTTLMVMLICIVLGVVSLMGSPMELMPKLNAPVAVVVTTFPGASPQEVASHVTELLESAVATTPGLTNLSSTSQESLSLMILQFDWGTNMEEARYDIQQALDRVDLPEGALKPSLMKFDPNMMPVIELTVADGADLSALKARLEADVQPRLDKVDGVAAVYITGAPDNEIQVRLNQDQLQKYGLTQTQISQVIQASNLTYPAGKVDLDDQSLNLRILGETAGIEELRNLTVSLVPDLPTTGIPTVPGALPGTVPSGIPVPMKPLLLGDVAEVIETHAQPTVINRTNGSPSLRVTIQKEGQANTVTVSKAVQEEIAAIEADHAGLDLTVVMNQGDLITDSINNVSSSLVGGGLLAILILLLFLRSIWPTLIIGVAIPFSVIVTFVLIFMQGLTMNIMTLGGLALGVGMLVDNAIVVIENIYRRMNELGEDPYTAAELGANEVAGAITSSTLTTVAVFLPVVFVGGLTGELFKELGLTVTFSLIASLAVALTVIPMMAARFLKPSKRALRHEPVVTENWYTRLLRWTLRNRAITVVSVLILFAASVALYPFLGSEFLPVVDERTFNVSVKMPPGTALEATAEKVAAMADQVQELIPTELITTSVGQPEGLAGLAANASGADGTIRVIVSDEYDKPTTEAITLVREALEKDLRGAVLSYNLENQMASMGGSSNGIQVIVTGPDPAQVRDWVGKIEDQLLTVDGIVSVENNLDTAKPELQVVVDQAEAMGRGLVPAQVAMTVANAVKGQIITRVGDGEAATDVRVLYRTEDRDAVAKLEGLLLKTPLGQSVPLRDVADVRDAMGPVAITREDQKLSAQVTGLIEGRDLGTVTADVTAAIDELDLPAGYAAKAGGASEMMADGFTALGQALLLAVLLIYMIMASQFESLLHPFTILFTMPLAAIGVIVGLVVTGHAMGITAMIGVIILTGIVVNNGIVLIDFINQRRAAGMPLVEAIVESGRTRIRPILMTASTTILGLLPLAIGLGEGTEIQAPMAVAVIGGLLTSTVLTLLFIPVLYHIFAGKRTVTVAGATAPQGGPVEAGRMQATLLGTAEPVTTFADEFDQSAALDMTPAEAERLQDRTAMTSEDFHQLLSLLGKLFQNAGSKR